jgi:hypothetical protein
MIKIMSFIICAVISITTIPSEAGQDYYDRDGRRVGSQDDNRYYDRDGRLKATRDRDRNRSDYYDRDGRRLWTEQDDEDDE